VRYVTVRGLRKCEKGEEVCAWYVCMYEWFLCVFCISSVMDMCVYARKRER